MTTLCCSGCGELNREDIAAFLRGETHIKSDDLAWNTHCSGGALWVDVRRRKYRETIAQNPDDAILWPEFGDLVQKRHQFVTRLVQTLLPKFTELVRTSAEFRDFCRERPLVVVAPNSIRGRRRFGARAVRPYQVRTIQAFVGEYGSEKMYELAAAYGVQLPWWDTPITKQERSPEALAA